MGDLKEIVLAMMEGEPVFTFGGGPGGGGGGGTVCRGDIPKSGWDAILNRLLLNARGQLLNSSVITCCDSLPC